MDKSSITRARVIFLIWVVLFFAAFLVGSRLVGRQVPLRSAFAEVCDFVTAKIYKPRSELGPWPEDCHREAQKIVASDAPDQVLMRMNVILSSLKVSHLGGYAPVDVRRVWNSQYKTTGVRSRYVEGEVVVVGLLSGSPAELAGLRVGDLLKTINGELAQVAEAESEPGEYVISRRGRMSKVQVGVADLQVDDRIQWSPASKNTIIVKVPSFRIEFLESEYLKQKIVSLAKFKNLILDLRENRGGSFVAGLRFLSGLLCEPQVVGRLYKPRNSLRVSRRLADDASEEAQVDVINEADEVQLKTFPDYGCWKGKISVLVGAHTSSTAEIVAQALKDFSGGRVLGASSDGSCLVGIWYPLHPFGVGYKISIPEALYETASGRTLEGDGVQVDKTLYENLEDYVNGEDSLVKQAAADF